jgi:hypothetical protein
MKTNLVKSFMLCFVLLCLTPSASAYTTQYEWPNSHVGYTIHSSIPSSFYSPINAAASAWSNANADFDYFLSVNSNK